MSDYIYTRLKACLSVKNNVNKGNKKASINKNTSQSNRYY